MRRKRKMSVCKKKASPACRMRTRACDTVDVVKSQLTIRAPKHTTDTTVQKRKLDKCREVDKNKVMLLKRKGGSQTLASLQESQSMEPGEKKLKMVVRKNSETGEWSASEEKHKEVKKCAKNTRSDCKVVVRRDSKSTLKKQFKGQSDSKPKKCTSGKSLAKRKTGSKKGNVANTTLLKTAKKISDCKSPEQENEIDKLKLEVNAVRKKPCKEMETKKGLPGQTVYCHYTTPFADIEDKVSILNKQKVPTKQAQITCNPTYLGEDSILQGQVSSANEACAKYNEYEYASEDVYVVELFDGGGSIFSDEREFESGDLETAGNHKKVDIKLLPYKTPVYMAGNSAETEVLDLGSTCTSLCDNSLEIDTDNIALLKNEGVITEDDVDKDYTGTDCQIHNNGTVEEAVEKKEHAFTSQPDIDTTTMNETVIQKNATTNEVVTKKVIGVIKTAIGKNTDVNEPVIRKNTDANETDIVKISNMNETIIKRYSNIDKPTTEKNKDVNETILEKNAYVNGTIMRMNIKINKSETGKKSGINETAKGNDTDINETAVEKNVNINETAINKTLDLNELAKEKIRDMNETKIEKDLHIAETEDDQLLEIDSLDPTPGNFRDIDKLINWTVAQTLYQDVNMADDALETNQNYNLQESIENVDQLDRKSTECSDDNNNCMIEVYIIDDTEANENNNTDEIMVHDNEPHIKDRIYAEGVDENINIDKTAEHVYESSDMKDKVYAECVDCGTGECVFESDVIALKAKNQADFNIFPFDGQVDDEEHGMSLTKYTDQVSLEDEDWLPLTDTAYMSPVTDLRYENIPYWDPCLVGKLEKKEPEFDGNFANNPVLCRNEKSNSKNKQETNTDLISHVCNSTDKCLNEKYQSEYSEFTIPVNNHAVMQKSLNTDKFLENRENKYSFIGESLTAATGGNESKGLIKTSAKTDSDGQKTSFKVKKVPTRGTTCNSVEKREKKKKNDLCTRIADNLVQRKKMLKRLKNGQHGDRPRIIRVKEEGIIIDVTEEYKEHLPFDFFS